jgi:large subunit ribosomal protein L30
MADLSLKQVRSANKASARQRDTLRSLRLGRIGRSANHADTPQLRGMLRVVGHLVEVDGADKKGSG